MSRCSRAAAGGWTVLVFAAWLALPQAAAQTDPTLALPGLAESGPSAPLPEPAVPDSFVIGRDDLLEIQVLQMPELHGEVRVDADGKVQIPYLSQRVVAAGRTAPQVAAVVAQTLVAVGYAVRPQVQVMVRQVRSHPIVVTGAVKNPQVLQAVQPMSLLEVLSRVGGVDGQAGASLLVTHRQAGQVVAQSYSLAALLQDAGAAAEPQLDGGETVRVLPARLVYVVGALGKPGAFPLQAGEPLTVLKALALAQGFKDPADRSHAQILRTSPQGMRQEIPVNLDKLLKHQVADIPLQAGDIFYVPENGRARSMQTIIADAGQMAVIAVGYNATKIF